MKINRILIFVLMTIALLLSIDTAQADNANSIIYGITSSSLVVYDPNSNTMASYYINDTLDDFTVTPSHIFITSHDGNGKKYVSVINTKNYEVIHVFPCRSSTLAASQSGVYVYTVNDTTIERVDWRNNHITSLSLGSDFPKSLTMSPDDSYLEVACFGKGYSIATSTFTIVGTYTGTTESPNRIRASSNTINGIDVLGKKWYSIAPLFGLPTGAITTTTVSLWATPSGIDTVPGSNDMYIVYSDNNAVTLPSLLAFNSSSYNNDIATSNDGTLIYLASSTTNQINVYATNSSHTALGYISTPGVILKLQNGYRSIEYDMVSTQNVKFIVSSPFGLTTYSNVMVSVLDSTGTILYSQKTGDDGSVVFPLQPAKMYTVTAYDSTQNINKTISLYPTSTSYMIDVGISPIINFGSLWHSADINQSHTFTSGTGDPLQDVTLTVSQSPRNTPTNRVITAVYNDDTISTGLVNFSLYKVTNNVSTYVSSQTFTLAKTGNMIVNGNFETNIDGWSVYSNPSTMIKSSDWAYSSSYSLKGIRSGINPCTLYTTVPVISGNTYKINFKYKPMYTGTETVSVYTNEAGVHYLTLTNKYGTQPYNSSVTSGTVYNYELYGTATETGNTYLNIPIDGGSANAIHYVDDVSITSNNVQAIFNIANEVQSKSPSTYKIVVTANTDAYGVVQRVSYSSWDGSGYLLPGFGLNNKALPYEWICFGIIFLIIIIGTFMSNGIIIFIAGAAWEIMIAIGWMNSSAQNLALGALVMAIGAGYILMQKRREVV